jgi:CO/xanthine dehydrogenase Mo-binding subunit
MPHGAATRATAPRGFGVNRSDGQRPLPGSLHTNRRLSQWIGLSEPSVVRVFTGKAELGQGILTALQLIAAEELDVPLSAVRVCSARTDTGPDEGMTSGSLSVQDSGGALRHVCAEVRGLALQRAAERARLPVESLSVHDGECVAPQGHALGDYWSLLSDADLNVEYQGRWLPKPASQRRLLGRTQVPRVDLADKVFGRARFIHDLRLPGMRHGRVVRAPLWNATLAKGLPELSPPLGLDVQCWADGSFVAVVAATESQAEAAAERLRAGLQWQRAHALPDADDLPAFLRAAEQQTTMTAERGEAAWPQTGRHVRAEYFKPYLAHASIGPSCALAQWDGKRLEVWTHSQGIHNLREDIVLALEAGPHAVAKQDIVIHHVEGAGCYGHNGADDVAFDAVLMALHSPGRPVRVQWSRADELAHSPFGSAHAVSLQARVDDAGRLTHWQHELWSNGYSSRPGRAKVPALLAASQREAGAPLPLPINPPLANGGGAERNAVPAYAVPNLRVVTHRLMTMPLRTSALRALGAFTNVFAIESFVDEIAHALDVDALEFRRRHLDDPRALAVLDTVVARSTWWGTRATAAEGIGHGMAWARYKNSGAWCAVLARVQAERDVRVLNLDLAVDVGMVVDLDGVINQFEGGAIQSASWTLKEQVTFDAQTVTSVDWAHYPVLRFSEVPRVTVHVIDRPDEPPLGAGEAAQGPVAAALANAVFDALGVRVRSLPLSAENIVRAIEGAQA